MFVLLDQAPRVKVFIIFFRCLKEKNYFFAMAFTLGYVKSFCTDNIVHVISFHNNSIFVSVHFGFTENFIDIKATWSDQIETMFEGHHECF